MSRWYSDRGAKRGLLSVTVFGVLWVCWAFAYTAGLVNTTNADPQRIELRRADHSVAGCKCDAPR